MENQTSLHLVGNHAIVELSRDMLQNYPLLEYLHIADCHQLESFSEDALQGLGSLQVLSISHCVKFHSLSEGLRHLTSLERLVIRQCPDLVAFPVGIENLHSLQVVELDGIQACPGGLQYISSLKCLRVSGCPNFVSSLEWLENLTSLRFLLIDYGLTRLPRLSSFTQYIRRTITFQRIIWCLATNLRPAQSQADLMEDQSLAYLREERLADLMEGRSLAYLMEEQRLAYLMELAIRCCNLTNLKQLVIRFCNRNPLYEEGWLRIIREVMIAHVPLITIQCGSHMTRIYWDGTTYSLLR